MDPAILLIIVFIVAPLIERLLKAGKRPEEPPEQLPHRRIPQQRPSHRFPDRETRRPQREEPASASADDDAAAAMLPDDLWEILTGERRSPALPVPPDESEEVEQAYAAEEYAEDARAREMASREGLSPGEWISRPREEARDVVPHDAYVRPLPEREVPRVVSLENLEFDAEKRHESFHDRLDALGGPARVRRPAPGNYRFRSDEDLRRAIVMTAILGTPKGLE